MEKHEKLDYEKIGLKCGIEIHQQLDTKKLFCTCPSIIRDDKHDYEITRRLNAVIGESGEIDAAAQHEKERERYFVYQGYLSSVCLVELDEEPPHLMNNDALDIVLQVSLMLKAKIVDEIQVMRKTVIDGSNTGGFQRTSLVARNGVIESTNGKITIPTISIEEDSCKIVKREKNHDIYNLSRLGIPLIEIGTGPDIKTPSEAKEVAEKIGMVLRSTGKVKRGLGSIRQDVNVSVKEGMRIEIKGAQDLRMISTLVEYEAKRQLNLIDFKKNRKEIHISKSHELKELLKDTTSKVLRKSLDNNGTIIAIKIDNFKGMFKWEICPGKRFGAELSDYAKILAGVGGLFHSDELPNYGITEDEVKMIKHELHVKDDDGFLMIADNKIVAEKAITAIKERLHKPLQMEVRKANDDGTTSFMRPMSSGARMYPETDTVPIIPDIKHIKLPELIEHKIIRFEKTYNISNDLATPLVKEGIDFEDIVKKYKNVSPLFIANLLINSPKEIKKRYLKEIDITKHLDELLIKVSNNEITNEAVFEILVEIAHDRKVDYSKYKTIDEKVVEDEIKEIIEKNPGKTSGALMGIVMAKFRGKIDGKKVNELLSKYSK